MSEKYDEYLKEHDANVRKAYHWIKKSAPDILKKIPGVDYSWHIDFHDDTKTIPDEYKAYDEYLFGPKTKYTEQNYRIARLGHIHRSPHHWQHWMYFNDETGVVLLEMPYEYIVEMVCNWWSYSWKDGDLYSIFDYYESKKGRIKLHKKSRENLEEILKILKDNIDRVKNKK